MRTAETYWEQRCYCCAVGTRFCYSGPTRAYCTTAPNVLPPARAPCSLTRPRASAHPLHARCPPTCLLTRPLVRPPARSPACLLAHLPVHSLARSLADPLAHHELAFLLTPLLCPRAIACVLGPPYAYWGRQPTTHLLGPSERACSLPLMASGSYPELTQSVVVWKIISTRTIFWGCYNGRYMRIYSVRLH